MYNFHLLFQEVKKYKKEIIIANIISLMAALIGATIPLFIPFLVDEVLLEKKGAFTAIIDMLLSGVNPPYIYILIALGLAIFLRIIFFVLNFYQTKIFTIISKNITFKIRENILSHLQNVSLSGYEFFGSGKASSLIVVDVDTIDNFLGTTISRLVISILMLISVSIVLFVIDWKMAIFIILINPFVVLLTTKIAQKISKLKKRQNKTFSLFQDAFNETLEMFVQVKASNQEKEFIASLKQKAKDIKQSSIEFSYKSDAANRFSFLIFMFGFELFRALGIFMVAYSTLSIGLMLAIFSYLWVMLGPIQDILNIQYAYHNAKMALERINEIFALQKEPHYPKLNNPFHNTQTNSLSLENITFSYDEKTPILQNINMKIKKGSRVAIVGASGSGKTSLASLIVGFYPFQGGKLSFDGISSDTIGLDVIRDNVFLVLQNPQLFNSTIRENITLGLHVKENLIQKAIHIAQLKPLISSLENGLDTKVGKHGIKLSGGERQRLSIARMVVKNPNIVILDESTSALDVNTEDILFQEIDEYLKGKTTIIIAHRLSTIRSADYIYVLDKGVIVEEGSHEELLQKDGVFAFYYAKHG